MAMNIRMIDTAAASKNEHIIGKTARGIGEPGTTIDVVTKVWYTHLGFNRTLLSVRNSLKALLAEPEADDATLRVTVLLHWPRCYSHIPWMRCEDEESELPAEVRELGPAPHLDPDGAWQESWKALELLQGSGEVANIGVSNFAVPEMKQLLQIAERPPQLLQANVWIVLFDPALMTLIKDKEIVLQVLLLLRSQFFACDVLFHSIQSLSIYYCRVACDALFTHLLYLADTAHALQPDLVTHTTPLSVSLITGVQCN